MSDAIDQANELNDLFLRVALANNLNSRNSLPYTGYCYNCDERVEQSAHFCDSDCRYDWERRTRR